VLGSSFKVSLRSADYIWCINAPYRPHHHAQVNNAEGRLIPTFLKTDWPSFPSRPGSICG